MQQMNMMPKMQLPSQPAQLRLPNMGTAARTAAPMTAPRLPVMMQPGAAGTAGKALNMNILRAQSFTPMKEEMLTNSLTSMKLPVTKENVALARSMVEGGVPLTAQNHKELKEALSRLPSSRPSDMQAASFLKSSSVALTPQNVTTMSNFLSTNPQIGAHFFEFSQEFRKLSDGKSGKLSADKMALLAKTSGLLGELMMDGLNKTRAKNAKAFREMGRQAGLQFPAFMGKQDDEELTEMMKLLRQMLFSQDNDESMAGLKRALTQAEETLLAQQLINRGKREGQQNFYYMQIPLGADGREFTAEMKLYYTTDYQGRKIVDIENFELELVVPSVNLGDLRFHLKTEHGIMNLEAGVEDAALCNFVSACLPVLIERIGDIGFITGRASVQALPEKDMKAVEVMELEAMESLDMFY